MCCQECISSTRALTYYTAQPPAYLPVHCTQLQSHSEHRGQSDTMAAGMYSTHHEKEKQNIHTMKMKTVSKNTRGVSMCTGRYQRASRTYAKHTRADILSVQCTDFVAAGDCITHRRTQTQHPSNIRRLLCIYLLTRPCSPPTLHSSTLPLP